MEEITIKNKPSYWIIDIKWIRVDANIFKVYLDLNINNALFLKKSWIYPIILLGILMVSIFIIYYNTLIEMMSMWNTHTYAYCYLIIPISLYLIYKKRIEIFDIDPMPQYYPVFLVLFSGVIWYIGRMAGIKLVQEYALFFIIIFSVWSVLGHKVVATIQFPLLFILFSVPTGDFLLPVMINFTTEFTVGMIRLVGIPIYREGNYFSLPSGEWSVVEACAGLRYLIASVTLGCLFSYLNYESYLKRCIFILLSGIVPVFLNGIRAFLIVMMGHYSGMKMGVGDDHFVYGWIFFGLGMGLLFWLGSKWSDDYSFDINVCDSPRVKCEKPTKYDIDIYIVPIIIILIIAFWPYYADTVEHRFASVPDIFNDFDKRIEEQWQVNYKVTSWRPIYKNSDSEFSRSFDNKEFVYGYFVEYYKIKNIADLLSTQNYLINEDNREWRLLKNEDIKIYYDGKQIKLTENIIKSQNQSLIIWQTNLVHGVYTNSNIHGKILTILDLVFGNLPPSLAIIAYIEYKDNDVDARLFLEKFYSQILKSIH